MDADVFAAEEIAQFENQSVFHYVVGTSFGFHIEGDQFGGGGLVADVELLADVGVGFFYDEDWGAYAGDDVAFSERLAFWGLRVEF